MWAPVCERVFKEEGKGGYMWDTPGRRCGQDPWLTGMGARPSLFLRTQQYLLEHNEEARVSFWPSQGASCLSFLATACPRKHSSVAGHHHGAGELGPHCEHGRAVWAAWKLQVGGHSWPARKALTVSLLSWSPSTIPLTSQRWTGPCWAKRSVWTTVGAYLVIPASSSQTWHSCHSSFSSGHTPWPWPWRSSNSAVTSRRR